MGAAELMDWAKWKAGNFSSSVVTLVVVVEGGVGAEIAKAVVVAMKD